MNRINFYKRLVCCGIIVIACFCFRCAKNSQKILFINSYHPGYAPSDSVEAGIRETLTIQKGVVFTKHDMIPKRQHDARSIQENVQETLKTIKRSDPDVVITYGDDVIKYVIAPYFRKKHIPVVFCGVKWACDQYGLPTETITGMLEVLPIQDMVNQLRPYYPEMHRLSVISENTVSERKNIKYISAILLQIGVTAHFELVDDFIKWENAFIHSNVDADLIFLPTNGGISGWNEHRAYEFVSRNIRKPVITGDPSMMHFAVFGITKINREQGIWAARASLKILSGQPVKDIPVAINRETKRYLNLKLADRIQFRPNNDFLKHVEKID